ncbi:sialic acid-binding Ig-like lectin 14 [Labeo rohita]|uniref:Sialic acid-binding Ig-like lectin 14 n=1 Tax=Labeo rohita TaxID=84645 RepID=A0A498MI37_LABRO|nr:sialic acid-binding Ig-like lectin 14 [Labeo rohita]
MEALVSSCVVLPCTFKYPAQQQPSDRIRAMWHMKNKWDDIIFHKDQTRVLDNFKGRTKLLGSLGSSNCTLEIDEVKNHDNGPYCFRVELETSQKDKYSFVDNCVSIKMIEQASKPELQTEQSVKEGEPAVFKCSVRHTCPSHQPTLTWSHPGKTIMSYKDIGHGNWEAESLLTFTPTQKDDHGSITCTVKYHGNAKGEMTATRPIFVKGEVKGIKLTGVLTANLAMYPALFIQVVMMSLQKLPGFASDPLAPSSAFVLRCVNFTSICWAQNSTHQSIGFTMAPRSLSFTWCLSSYRVNLGHPLDSTLDFQACGYAWTLQSFGSITILAPMTPPQSSKPPALL